MDYNYKPGDWVKFNNGTIRKFHNVEDVEFHGPNGPMVQKHGVVVERLLTPDEIPEFSFEYTDGCKMDYETFWTICKKHCPDAVHEFCEWIDQYKLQMGWDKIFQPNIKFHDIPFSMQYGIMLDFTTRTKKVKEIEMGKSHLMGRFGEMFVIRQVEIVNSKVVKSN